MGLAAVPALVEKLSAQDGPLKRKINHSDYWERFPAKVNAVSTGETQSLAQKYLAPGRAHIVAVGDGSRIRGALEKLGKIETGG